MLAVAHEWTGALARVACFSSIIEEREIKEHNRGFLAQDQCYSSSVRIHKLLALLARNEVGSEKYPGIIKKPFIKNRYSHTFHLRGGFSIRMYSTFDCILCTSRDCKKASTIISCQYMQFCNSNNTNGYLILTPLQKFIRRQTYHSDGVCNISPLLQVIDLS